MDRKPKEAIEKSHDEPEAGKKEKANSEAQQADNEGDDCYGQAINKPGDETL